MCQISTSVDTFNMWSALAKDWKIKPIWTQTNTFYVINQIPCVGPLMLTFYIFAVDSKFSI